MTNLTPEQFHNIHKGWNNKLTVWHGRDSFELTLNQFTVRFLSNNTSFEHNGKRYRIESGMVKNLG